MSAHKPPPTHSPRVIGEDIMESFNKWSQLEILRIRAKYKIDERVAINAVAMTVLGANVTVLKLIGKTAAHIVSIIKGQEAS